MSEKRTFDAMVKDLQAIIRPIGQDHNIANPEPIEGKGYRAWPKNVADAIGAYREGKISITRLRGEVEMALMVYGNVLLQIDWEQTDLVHIARTVFGHKKPEGR